MSTNEEQVEEVTRRTSTQSDRRASQASKHSDKPASPPKGLTPTEEAASPIKNEQGHIAPVRAAPPPPPKKKITEEAQPTVSGEYPITGEEAPLQSEFGDPSQFYEGYGGGKFENSAYKTYLFYFRSLWSGWLRSGNLQWPRI